MDLGVFEDDLFWKEVALVAKKSRIVILRHKTLVGKSHFSRFCSKTSF